jgi:hypothetical protein
MDEHREGGAQQGAGKKLLRGLATWVRSRPAQMMVTVPGMASQVFRVAPPPGDRPDWRMLLGTGWSFYPGSEWAEVDMTPGVWEIPVFPQPVILTRPLTDGG